MSQQLRVAADCGDYDGGVHPCIYGDEGQKLAMIFVQPIYGAGREYDQRAQEHQRAAQDLATLFATAPELLKALENIELILSAYVGNNGIHATSTVLNVLAQATSAIAKAKGEQP